MIVYPDIDKGFRKIDPDQWEFGNDEFIKGQRHLLKNIHRRKPIHSHSTPPQGISSTALSPSERQEYEDEIKKLKNETGSLRLQLQNHKRENQENETKLTYLNERLRSIKLKQRKMISFLAQSLEKPKNSLETNSKKRRLMISTYLQDEANEDENDNLDIHELITKLDSKLRFWAEFVEDVKTSGQEKYDLADSPTVSLIYTNHDSRVKTKSSGIDVNAEPVAAADVKPVKSGANDVFWEQFLTETPGGGDTQEVQSERRDVIKSLWSMNNLDKITEKMGNLSPSGQMFGFCRFNGVDNSQNLIDSLNGVWIGKLRLHANIARFDKKEGFRHPQANVKKFVTTASTSIKRGDNSSHSFVNVVKGVSNGEKMGTGGMPVDDSPTVYVSQEDNSTLELAILGCHKDFRSIANSRIICRNEGFSGVDIKYLGGLWVLFVFKDKHARDKFINHKGIQSWFTSLEPWYDDFVLNERLIWLEIEGVPIRAWHNDTFKSVCRKWGEALFIDDSDSSNRFSIRLCIKSSHNSLIFASTTVKLNGVTYAYRVRELCSWTLNFTHEVMDMEEEGYVADDGTVEEEGFADNSSNADGGKVEAEEEELMGELFCNDDNETPPNMKENLDAQPSNSDPFELEHLFAKNGSYKSNKQGSSKFPPGFTKSDDGDKQNDFSKVNKHEHLVHHESKSIRSSQVKDDEVPRKYVGVSMIQQVEDTIKVGIALGFNMNGCQDMLQKMIVDIGDDIETKLLHVDLWSLRQVWGNTHFDFASTSAMGRSGVMGDFNEVREAAERSGSVFNERHSEIFNSFITNMTLFDVPLGGFRFTCIDKHYLRESSSKKLSDNQMKKEHQDWLSLIDAKVDQGSASSDDLTLRISSLKILGDIERKEASDLAQKAKVKWALEGDENTSPGPRASDGVPIIEDVDFKQISVEQQEFLECDVSNEEIKRAVWNCGSDRAPGPDGFTFKFFKTFWDVIQDDVVRDDLTLRISSLKILCDIECKEASDLAQKAKVKWALKGASCPIIQDVDFKQISVEQQEFLEYGPLVLNECMAWYRKRRKALMVFKVDFKKAFDSLRWDYLDVIMEKLGFGFKWRMWISGCIKNSRASILINGLPNPEFDMFNVPIGSNMGRCDNWKCVVQKFESKMNWWKAKLLSVGGRLSLIKAVLVTHSNWKNPKGYTIPLNKPLNVLPPTCEETIANEPPVQVTHSHWKNPK
nr:heat stress transcription factor A-4c-like [Tanacetum cinerariifolium]